MKSIFLLETEENCLDFDKIDYNLMANDKKIMEWEGFYSFLNNFLTVVFH